MYMYMYISGIFICRAPNGSRSAQAQPPGRQVVDLNIGIGIDVDMYVYIMDMHIGRPSG